MKRLIAYSADAEVSGQLALTLTHSIRFEDIRPILQKYGLNEIDPNQWYPHQLILDMFREIQTARPGMDSVYDLVSIGIKSIESTGMPPIDPAVVPLKQLLLKMLVDSLSMGHRGTNPGRAVAYPSGDHKVTVEDHTPFPHDLIFGAFFGMAQVLQSLYKVSIQVERIGCPIDPDTGDEVGVYQFSW